MKNFNFQSVEVLSVEELACVKGGDSIGIPVPIIIEEILSLFSLSVSTTSKKAKKTK